MNLAAADLACVEFVELVTDYLEDALSLADRARFDAHVAECPGCERYLEQLRATAAVLGRVTLDAISPRARTELLDAFRHWHGTTSPTEQP